MTFSQKEAKGSILVVDDEDDIVQFVQDAFEDEGYSVYRAFSGKQALQVVHEQTIDLIILDIMLPGHDGFSVCTQLREKWDIPILFLSARQSDDDKIQGFRVGADDYVMKPFSMKELIARVEVHLRRHYRGYQPLLQPERVMQLHYDELFIDLNAYEVRYMKKNVSLTRKEFEIVQLLALHPQQIFSREVIYDRIWGMDSPGSSETVTEHIKRIRRKLTQCGSHLEYIGTVWGVGYKWERNTSL